MYNSTLLHIRNASCHVASGLLLLLNCYHMPADHMLAEKKGQHADVSIRQLQVELRSRALLASGAQDIVVPVYDEEPTSIIAYALASRLPTLASFAICLACGKYMLPVSCTVSVWAFCCVSGQSIAVQVQCVRSLWQGLAGSSLAPRLHMLLNNTI